MIPPFCIDGFTWVEQQRMKKNKKRKNKSWVLPLPSILAFENACRLTLSNFGWRLRFSSLVHMAFKSGETAPTRTRTHSEKIRKVDCCCFWTENLEETIYLSICLFVSPNRVYLSLSLFCFPLLTQNCYAVGWPKLFRAGERVFHPSLA